MGQVAAELSPPIVDKDRASAPGADPSHEHPRAERLLPRIGDRPPRKSNLKLDPISRAIFYAILALIHALSLIPDFILYRLGKLGGVIAYCLDRRHIAIGRKNLAIAFPEKTPAQRSAILRASYENLGISAAEYIRLAGFFHLRLRDLVTYHRLEYWEEIAAKYPGKGVLVLTAHFGNFELLPAVHAMHGYQISLVHHTQRFLPGDALVTFVRERAGVENLRKHSAARAVLKSLREGDLVGIPFDQNAKRSEAIFVPFFGEPAATTSGLARLAVMSEAPIVPIFLIRQPDGRRHVIDIRNEIIIQRSDDKQADLVENTKRFVKAVEDVVREYPEQFLWTHRRYRTRPRGMAPIYEKNRAGKFT